MLSFLRGMLGHMVDMTLHDTLLYYVYCFHSVLNLVSLKFVSSGLDSSYNLIS